MRHLKFKHSEKATNFCENSTADLSYVVAVKSTVEILQNFVAFSEYKNFNKFSLFWKKIFIKCVVLKKEHMQPSNGFVGNTL